VYLVGAGPGDPGLLTVRGRDVLAAADVVLYDALVDARLLDLAPPGALLVDVGKAQGNGVSGAPGTPGGAVTPEAQGRPDGARRGARAHAGYGTSQETMNALLVRYGATGKAVVRLKGGDPFVFGRGGEEALALAAASIPFEVVPGVSSAIAAPAYAGIPVTHRGVAASVAVVTGHEAPDKAPEGAHVDWARLATAVDTLVILMGVGTLPRIAAALVAHGRAPDTPAAAIERATTRDQRVVAGTLERLPALVAAAGVRSPAVVVVGEVVRLRPAMDWLHGSVIGVASGGAAAGAGRQATEPREAAACA
jgi:uroporphyrinogen III methyltransferase/synthase